ncbi:MAG: hypothetical protein Q9212_003996 [Teloschistes hypoglaucus]
MISSSGDPVYFFREYDHPYGFLSQWFESSFTAPSPDDASKSVVFRNTEQYMMYHKAVLFRDLDTAQQIMLATTPRKQKALGRKVKNFDGKQWDAHREQIVENGNWNKFCNSKDGTNLKDMLLETGDRELVEVRATAARLVFCALLIFTLEASPFDRIWGIGFGEHNAKTNRSEWGLNLLGKALMRVRDRINTESSSKS